MGPLLYIYVRKHSPLKWDIRKKKKDPPKGGFHKKKDTMEIKQTIELYKSTQKFLTDLNNQLISNVYEAIRKASKDLGVDPHHFYAITEAMRAPFGCKPTGVQMVEDILNKAESTEEYVEFREDVFMGTSHYRKVLTAEVKLIAEYL